MGGNFKLGTISELKFGVVLYPTPDDAGIVRYENPGIAMLFFFVPNSKAFHLH